ncbi:MAG: Ig-like domain-containing protein [Jatrophihabitans sp.]
MSTLAALSACTAGGSTPPGTPPSVGAASTGSAHSESSPPPTTPTPTPTPAIITTSAGATQQINPVTPVTVSIAHGTLTSVTMTNAAGTKVTGALSPDRTSWHDTEDLGYGKTYAIIAVGKNDEGMPVTKRESVTVISPTNQTAVSLDRAGDYALTDGATYGVAVMPEIFFDEPLSAAGQKTAEKALTVSTSPHVAGAWAWQDDTRLLWRPENYWPSGTNVTIKANVYGVDFGNGLYGQSDEQTSFTIGRKQLTIADDNAPKAVDKIRVYNAAGTVLRTMDTSMGQHSGETVNGQYFNFYTLNGTYTVLEHDNPAIMSSQSYGLPAGAANGYGALTVPYSTKISVDGIYLHEFNSTTYDQEHGIDVSEGCLNLQTSDAEWFFDHSLIGDPVVVHGAKGAPEIDVAEGGGWSVSWKTWLTGALSNN